VEEPKESFDRLQRLGQVRIALDALMQIDAYAWDQRGVLTLRGRFLQPAEQIYRSIRQRLEALELTPMLRSGTTYDELVALPGVFHAPAQRLGLPVVLFLLTIVTTIWAGALQVVTPPPNVAENPLAFLWEVLITPALFLQGLPFALTLLTILFTHEMGHYLVGRWRGAPVSLPYFIPLPPLISFTGTMGAVIVQREPLEDRRTILEVGIAGPIAGLLVAIPLLIYGLATSTVGPPPAAGYLQEGNSLLYAALKWLVFQQWLPSNGVDVQLNPIAFGAWIGLLVTMLNLMPIGQLDGGHIAYAWLGERSVYLAYAMIAICAVLGILIPDNQVWLIWGVMALLIGARHPEPLNNVSTLSRGHIVLAIVGLLLFVLLFMPSPLVEIGAS
jgi:hypothetical protein